jgi:hypothetical protein
MLEAGISRWHPDPLAAFEAAEKRSAKRSCGSRKKVAARPRPGLAEPAPGAESVADTPRLAPM